MAVPVIEHLHVDKQEHTAIREAISECLLSKGKKTDICISLRLKIFLI